MCVVGINKSGAEGCIRFLVSLGTGGLESLEVSRKLVLYVCYCQSCEINLGVEFI